MDREKAVEINYLVGEVILVFQRLFPPEYRHIGVVQAFETADRLRSQIADLLRKEINPGSSPGA